MSTSNTTLSPISRSIRADASIPGMVLLALAILAAGLFFWPGTAALLEAWQLPEYSHGPLIPVLSGLLFLRQLKEYPPEPGPKRDRWVGVTVILAAIVMGTLGRLSNIDDIVAYSLILFIGGLLLTSFGWATGKHFWPPVVHLIYMLPLPSMLYYEMTTTLQLISSELGVWLLKLINVPVFLDGNIIDLGVIKLHVAEACSGLRYLFPILSFSYIFAVLYRGPKWHKAVLLISAVPITVAMNSVRIAIAGYIANRWGVEWVNGFQHFFEGWVIFIVCIAILFGLAAIMARFNPGRTGLVDALDLETDGLLPQVSRLALVQPSAALITVTGLLVAGTLALASMPERAIVDVARDGFALFPRDLGDWRQDGPRQMLDPEVESVLKADDYHQVTLSQAGTAASVGLFMAWYEDQSSGGVHSPEVCLPGAGWEIATLERIDVAGQIGTDRPFPLNRVIIQKGETRMMVYYWFQQNDRRITGDFEAKFWLMADRIRTGRTDSALVRLTTLIGPNESDATAEARLSDVLIDVMDPLPRFIPGD